MSESAADHVGPMQRGVSFPNRIVLTYVAIWIPAVVVASAIGFAVVMLPVTVNFTVADSWFLIYLFAATVVTPFVVGLIWYRVAARRLRERAPSAPEIPGHLWRASPLYLLAAILVAFATVGTMTLGSGGMFLISQFFSWPLMATIGGIVGDAVEWRSPHETGRPWAVDVNWRKVAVSILIGVLLVVILRTYVPRDTRFFVLPALLLWRAFKQGPLNTPARWFSGLSAVAWVVAISLESGTASFGALTLGLLSYVAGWDKPRPGPTEV